MASGNEMVPCVCAQHNPFYDSMTTSNTSMNRPVGHHPHHEFSQLEKFANTYTEVHGELSLLVCAFGIPMNVLNVFVLTRPHMRTPVNSILTWLAVFDLLTMASYVPFSLHFYCLYTPWELSSQRNSLGWMTFLIAHVDFTATTHTISNWLGVTLAVFRYKHIFLPAKGHLTRIRRLVRARIAVFVVVVLSVVVMIPNYIMNKLMPIVMGQQGTNNTAIAFVIQPLNLGTPQVKPLAQFNLWLHSVLAKLLPCILMVVYSALLLKTLRTNVRMISRASETSTTACPPVVSVKAEENGNYSHYRVETEQLSNGGHCDQLLLGCDGFVHHQLSEPSRESRSGSTSTEVSTMIGGNNFRNSDRQFHNKHTSTSSLNQRGGRTTLPKSRRVTDNARTTRMLLAVIILYVISELPQAVLIILSASLPDFFTNVYMPLGDMMDMLALFNNGINFLLYCIMSRDFRKTLVKLFDAKDPSQRSRNKRFKRVKDKQLTPGPVTINDKSKSSDVVDQGNVRLIKVTALNGTSF